MSGDKNVLEKNFKLSVEELDNGWVVYGPTERVYCETGDLTFQRAQVGLAELGKALKGADKRRKP